MDRITIDFENANRQARELEELAAQLKSLMDNDFSDTMQALAADWQSDSSDRYFNKGSRLQRQINNTASDLITIANNIRRTSRRIYEAEKRAEEIARQRQARS